MNANRVRRGMQSLSSAEENHAIGGDGGNGGMDIINYRLNHIEKQFDKLDARFDKLDARFEKIDARFDRADDRHHRDFRVLFGALIATALGLASLMAHGFKWF